MFDVIVSANFKKEAKKLIKKYPSLRSELALLGESLSQNPNQGTPLGNQVYKIRLAIASKGVGKSGGARVISFVHIVGDRVVLLSIYDKSDKATISDKEVKAILRKYI